MKLQKLSEIQPSLPFLQTWSCFGKVARGCTRYFQGFAKNLEKENRETNVTCFARKGPKPKDEDADLHTTRRIIGNLRATVMEGSFGNQKLHYGVGRIAARNQFCETLLLFFGIIWLTRLHLLHENLQRKKLWKSTAWQRPPYPFYIPTNGRNELLCTNVENSWPSGLSRMQKSGSVPIFGTFIAISNHMAFWEDGINWTLCGDKYINGC